MTLEGSEWIGPLAVEDRERCWASSEESVRMTLMEGVTESSSTPEEASTGVFDSSFVQPTLDTSFRLFLEHLSATVASN